MKNKEEIEVRVQVKLTGKAAYLFNNIKSKQQGITFEAAIILLAQDPYLADVFFSDVDAIDCILGYKKNLSKGLD